MKPNVCVALTQQEALGTCPGVLFPNLASVVQLSFSCTAEDVFFFVYFFLARLQFLMVVQGRSMRATSSTAHGVIPCLFARVRGQQPLCSCYFLENRQTTYQTNAIGAVIAPVLKNWFLAKRDKMFELTSGHHDKIDSSLCR